ncbi:MAG: VOC family protein [Acidimicrobiales bacterium]|jgi:hypothetical protein
MTVTIDHILYGCADVEAARLSIGALSGTAPANGGRHSGLGTRNALLSLGLHTYLEVIGPDEQQPEVGRPLPFAVGSLRHPSLRTWAARTDDIEGAVKALLSAGHDPGPVVEGSRLLPDGEELRWAMTSGEQGPEVSVVPFLIDWRDSVHPAVTSPPGLLLERLVVLTPERGAVTRALDALGVEGPLEVRASPAPALWAELSGPEGLRLFLSS